MCGRYLLTASPEEIEELFGYLDGEPFPPRYNIAPTQPIPVVRIEHHVRRFALVRWGLIPGWVKDTGDFPLLINARAESLLEKPAFRNAFRYRRCLVPASGFYEWQRRPGGGSKRPFWLEPCVAPVAFAGLWETWMNADGSEIDTACIVTIDSNAEIAPLHDRMPVVIPPQDYAMWLEGTPDEAEALLVRPPDGTFVPHEVSTQVNAVRNEGPALLDPPEQADLFG